jgi:hypothetical protein
MIYEKKTLELLADQRLLSRFNNKNIVPNNNIVKNINNHYTKIKGNNFNYVSQYINYVILLLTYIYIC